MSDVVDVVVTHYRSPGELADCLDTLRREHTVGSLRVTVADSEAQPGVAALVEQHFPGAAYLPFAENVGYARLANAGLLTAQSAYVCVMNADVQLSETALRHMTAHLDENDRVAVVGPRITHPTGEHQSTAFALYRPFTVLCRRTLIGATPLGRRELQRFTLRQQVAQAIERAEPLDVDWLMGATLLIRHTAIEEIGAFDERYFMYFEDVDLCLRAWRAGWRVQYLPTAIAIHRWARASRRGGIGGLVTNRLTRLHVRASVLFFLRWGTRPRRTITGRAPVIGPLSGAAPTQLAAPAADGTVGLPS